MPAALSVALATFIDEMNINFDTYKESVAGAMTRGRYSQMPDGRYLINPRGYIGRYQFSASKLKNLGLIKNDTQSYSALTNDENWVQVDDVDDEKASVKGELLAPYFDDQAIFTTPENFQLVPGSYVNFLLDPALQEKCFVASTYMNFLRLKKVGIIKDSTSSEDRAGWLNVVEFVGLGGAGDFLKLAADMVLDSDQLSQFLGISSAVGLFVNWKILKNPPDSNSVPDKTGLTPYKYFLIGSATQL